MFSNEPIHYPGLVSGHHWVGACQKLVQQGFNSFNRLMLSMVLDVDLVNCWEIAKFYFTHILKAFYFVLS